MNNECCKFETAVLAEKRGFKPPIDSEDYYWSSDGKYIHPNKWFTIEELPLIINAPTQTKLQKWIREVREIHIEVYCNASGWGWILTKLNGTGIKEIEDCIFFDSYEEALEEGLHQALKQTNLFVTF